jgi:hypothetical protein
MISIVICETKECENFNNRIEFIDVAETCICAGCGQFMRIEPIGK